MMHNAHAANISTVGSAAITKGELNLQLRNAASSDNDTPCDDGQWRTRYVLDYGVTDHYALGLYLETERDGGDDIDFQSIIFDQRFLFTHLEDDGFLSGMRIRYRHFAGDKGADAADIRFLASTRIDDWELRTYQIAGFDVGSEREAGLKFDSRFQVTYHTSEGTRFGLESFSNFGNLRTTTGFDRQAHYIGPIAAFSLTDDVAIECAYNRGISEAAADHSFRLAITRTF